MLKTGCELFVYLFANIMKIWIELLAKMKIILYICTLSNDE